MTKSLSDSYMVVAVKNCDTLTQIIRGSNTPERALRIALDMPKFKDVDVDTIEVFQKIEVDIGWVPFGSIWRFNGENFIFAMTCPRTGCMISLRDGNRYLNPKPVDAYYSEKYGSHGVTLAEFHKFSDGAFTFVGNPPPKSD